MRVVIVIFIFSFSLNLFSQKAPGYMGKRFVLGYGFTFSPVTLGTNENGNTLIGHSAGHTNKGWLAFNTFHEGYLEYALKTRIMIGASVKFYKTIFDNYSTIKVNNAVIYNPTTGTSFYSYALENNPQEYYEITGINYCLYFKFYHDRYVAPWGGYFFTGITINTSACFYDPKIMRLKMDNNGSYTPLYLTNFGEQGQFTARPDVVFGFGKSRILFNRFTIDYGCSAQLFALFSSFWDAIEKDPFSLTTPSNDNYIQVTTPGRIRGANRLNAYIKLGILF